MPSGNLSWWESRRLSFNVRILFGYTIAVLGMGIAACLSGAESDRNVYFQASGLSDSLTLLALVTLMSNLLYFVGPATERVISPRNTAGLRRPLFAILWVVPVMLMLAFAVWWASDVIQNPWLLDGGHGE